MGGSKKMQQVRSIANRPSGGGNKKQGLPPSIGRPGWLSNFIRSSAGGYFRGIPPAGPVDPCPTKEETVDYNIDSQEKAYALRGVTKITGYLKITGDITDWTPFNCLKHITGNFEVLNNAALKTISGFGSLTTIGGIFYIHSLDALTEISGFGSLTSVGGVFFINVNTYLTSIPTFDSLTTIVGDFSIASNGALTEISGFGNLTSVKSVNIDGNDALTEISGFNSLTEVRSDFINISGNDNLVEISGFGSLTSVPSFSCAQNANLTTISGFGNLKTIEGLFTLNINVKLTDASSLWNVVSVGGDFYCYENADFNNTAFARLVTSLTTIGGNINVYSNTAANDFAAPGELDFWGANTDRTLNGWLAAEAQDGSNSFGGVGVPTGGGTTQAAWDLFEVPVYTPP